MLEFEEGTGLPSPETRRLTEQEMQERRERLETEMGPFASDIRRKLEGHKINDANEQMVVRAHGERNAGGGCTGYSIQGEDGQPLVLLKFQDGELADGVNGITNEALLAIVADRLDGFQSGPFACEENERALMSILTALHVLRVREVNRRDRGVAGTHQP